MGAALDSLLLEELLDDELLEELLELLDAELVELLDTLAPLLEETLDGWLLAEGDALSSPPPPPPQAATTSASTRARPREDTEFDVRCIATAPAD